MVSHISINLKSGMAQPFADFIEGKDKELSINNILFYDDNKIVYRARLKKNDFIENVEKIFGKEKYIMEKYGIQYFEILETDRALKVYDILIIQSLPQLAREVLLNFGQSVFIIPPLILNSEEFRVNLITLPGELEKLKIFLENREINYEILKINRLETESDEDLLDREKIILRYAYESGFFEQPRRKNMKELSEKLGLTKSTFLRILRKAEKKIIGNYLDTYNFDLQ